MAFKVITSEEKVIAPKKKIKIQDVYVKDLKLVDETGDITQSVLEAIPDEVDTVSFSITIELPSDDE